MQNILGGATHHVSTVTDNSEEILHRKLFFYAEMFFNVLTEKM